jgi:hypothetical protein
LEELVMDLYSARKEAKEYLEYVIKPNDNGKLEEYREIITKEFFPNRGEPMMRFSICRKAISCFPRWDTHALRGYLPQPDTTSLHSSDCSSSMPRQTRLVCLDFGSV